MAEQVKKPLKITETVLRDAHQSLIATIFNVSRLRNASALVVAPTDVPRIITTLYISALEAVSASCLTTPLSLKRLIRLLVQQVYLRFLWQPEFRRRLVLRQILLTSF